MRNLLLALLMLFSASSFGHGLSSRRPKGKHHSNLVFASIDDDSDADPDPNIHTPEEFEVPLAQLNTSEVPAISDADFLSAFRYLRDTRFVTPTGSSFLRRLTWLFPDDGCYARAELMAQYAKEKHLPAPMKIFAFGDLEASTPNTPDGTVSWWYHVTIAYKHMGQVFVFDPAIEPSRPLTVTEWGNRIGMQKTEVKFALCSVDTFDPTADCKTPTATTRADALDELSDYLPAEWSRVQALGHDPYLFLGNQPPWLNH